jgi:hypothetical protein
MGASAQLSRLAPYAGRLLEDDAVQQQLDRALANLRSGSRRARRQGARKAARDPRTRHKLSAAATAGLQVARAMREPPPAPRHTGRRIVVLSLLAGAGTIVYRQVAEATPDDPEA